MDGQCPRCGAEIPGTVEFCPKCDRYLGWDRTPPGGGEVVGGGAPERVPSPPVGPPVRDVGRERVGGTVMKCQSDTLRVEPGSAVETSVEVGTTGTVVDEILLALSGPAAGVGTVTPDVVNLLPGATGSVVAAFAAPRGPGMRAGVHPWTLLATSKEHPGATSRIEGTLEVGRFVSGTAELEPTQTSGTGRAFEHTARLTNDGNCPWSVSIEPSGPSALRFGAGQGPVTVEPGQTTDAPVAVQTGRRWVGAPQSLPFEVRVAPTSPDAPGPWPLVGTRLQQPVLPSWLLTALMALAGLAIAAFAVFGRGEEPAVAVPSVEGSEAAAAEMRLKDAGFKVTVTNEPDQKAKGLAIRTNPPAGTQIPPGDPVTLIVSTGPPTTPLPVPPVVGRTEQEARQLLEDKSFDVRTTQQPSDEPAGTAIRTEPPAGTHLNPGDPVTLIVSSGPRSGGVESQSPSARSPSPESTDAEEPSVEEPSVEEPSVPTWSVVPPEGLTAEPVPTWSVVPPEGLTAKPMPTWNIVPPEGLAPIPQPTTTP